MRTGYADYWELYKRNALPKETKNYVPGIIAAIIMAKNPQQYGLEDMIPDAPVIADTVSVDYAVDLRLVADVTNASLQEIVELNPSLLRITTPRDMAFDLHLPPGTKDAYVKRIDGIVEDKRSSWRFHIVRPGESLDSIALSMHAHPSEIEAANRLASYDAIAPGDELVVPVAAAAVPHPAHYITRAGDTLVTIADRFNITVDQLRRWNHLAGANIKVVPGSRFHVAEPAAPPVSSHSHRRSASTSKSKAAHPASPKSPSASSRKPPARKSKSQSSASTQ